MPVDFTFSQTDKNAVAIDCDITTPLKDWEQWFLLRSDAHHDNTHCNQDMERRHLEWAKEVGAGIIDNGDLHCAMQGKYDKRSNKASLRPEYQNDRYLDSLVECAADFYEPYKDNWIIMGRGNHEQSIKNHHETDLTERTAAVMNSRGAGVIAGGYTNWIKFRFTRDKQKISKTLWTVHGYAGGGPVTKDLIQFNRQLAYVRGADYMMSGHTHDGWHTVSETVTLSKSGKVKRGRIHGIKCPSYKEEYGSGHEGWHTETGKPPKPVGAWKLRFYWEAKELKQEFIFAE